jgi:hypothetical protein
VTTIVLVVIALALLPLALRTVAGVVVLFGSALGAASDLALAPWRTQAAAALALMVAAVAFSALLRACGLTHPPLRFCDAGDTSPGCVERVYR